MVVSVCFTLKSQDSHDKPQDANSRSPELQVASCVVGMGRCRSGGSARAGAGARTGACHCSLLAWSLLLKQIFFLFRPAKKQKVYIPLAVDELSVVAALLAVAVASEEEGELSVAAAAPVPVIGK